MNTWDLETIGAQTHESARPWEQESKRAWRHESTGVSEQDNIAVRQYENMRVWGYESMIRICLPLVLITRLEARIHRKLLVVRASSCFTFGFHSTRESTRISAITEVVRLCTHILPEERAALPRSTSPGLATVTLYYASLHPHQKKQ